MKNKAWNSKTLKFSTNKVNNWTQICATFIEMWNFEEWGFCGRNYPFEIDDWIPLALLCALKLKWSMKTIICWYETIWTCGVGSTYKTLCISKGYLPNLLVRWLLPRFYVFWDRGLKFWLQLCLFEPIKSTGSDFT